MNAAPNDQYASLSRSAPDKRVKKAVDRILVRQHEIERLDVDEHVGPAERQEADGSGCRRVHECAGTEMEGSEGAIESQAKPHPQE